MIWRARSFNPFCLNVIWRSARFMACNIKLLSLDYSYIDIFLYALANMDGKEVFWAELWSYVASLSSPYILIGDFNETSYISDKHGGVLASSSRFQRTLDIKNSCNCAELSFTSSRFTWRKNELWMIIF